jgi:hypothetical protein
MYSLILLEAEKIRNHHGNYDRTTFQSSWGLLAIARTKADSVRFHSGSTGFQAVKRN